jgi:type I restriction enzyme M protein
LIEAEAEISKAVRNAEVALDEQVLARYAKLTEGDIKTLVVEDKWFTRIQAAIEGEVERLTQELAGRVKELEERYDRPLPELERDVEALGKMVGRHMLKMGLAWG